MMAQLGEGAFGTVTLALDKKNNRKVAVKTVDQDKTLKFNKVKHVMRERNLMNELNHPNIVNLLCTFKDDVNLYFIFEVAINGNLDQLVKKCQN